MISDTFSDRASQITAIPGSLSGPFHPSSHDRWCPNRCLQGKKKLSCPNVDHKPWFRRLVCVEYSAANQTYKEHPYVRPFSLLFNRQLKPPLLAILVGLLVMMWPVLTKVQYERLHVIFRRKSIWLHIGISIILNWVIAPCIMLGLAWATLPEAGLERERKGVILVGIARCIGEFPRLISRWLGFPPF